MTWEGKEEEEEWGGGGKQGAKKGSMGIYGDKMPGSGKMCGGDIDQWGMQPTRGPNPDP